MYVCKQVLYTHDEYKIPQNCVTLQIYCLHYYIIIIMYSFTIHFRFCIKFIHVYLPVSYLVKRIQTLNLTME